MRIFLLFLLLWVTTVYAERVIPKVIQRPKKMAAFPAEGGLRMRFQPSREHFSSSTTLPDYLQNQTGLIQFQQSNGVNPTEPSINLRGFGDNSSQNHLFLVNGFPHNVVTTTPNLNFLPLSSIEDVTLFSGSQGVRYGNGAVGGTLSVTTTRPLKNDLHWNMRVGDKHQLQNQLAWKLNQHTSLQVWSNLFHQSFKRDWQEHTERVLGMEWAQRLNTSLLNIQLMDEEYSSQFPGALSAKDYADSPNQSNGKQNELTTHVKHIQILHHYPLSLQHFLESRLWILKQTAYGKIGSPLTQHQRVLFWESRFFGKLKSKQKYEGGILLEHSDYDLISSVNQFATSNQIDFFYEHSFPLFRNTTLTLGARESMQWNQYNKSSFSDDLRARLFLYEVGIEHMISPELMVYARRDGNFRLVKANEVMFSSGLNSNLKPQKGVSYEAGMRYRHASIEAEVNAFHLDLENELAFNPEAVDGYPRGRFRNLSPTERNGFLVHYAFDLTRAVRFQHDVKWIRARFKDNPFHVPSIPEWSNDVRLQWSMYDDWRFVYRLSHLGERYASEDIQNQAGLQPAVVLHNAALVWNKKPWEWSLAIDNLFDKKYAQYTLFSPSTSELLYFPGNGRTLVLTLRVNLL